MKRIFEVLVAFMGLIISSPILIIFSYLIYRNDKASPIYRASRVGINGEDFIIIKLRSMVFNADTSGVDSTPQDDKRITPIGRIIRSYKLDEITQLWNVLTGTMSLVGPRPNVKRDVVLYSDLEMKLLTVKPGITDFSSIVFSDEGDILAGKKDPDLSYNQLIRPWKSRLGILYIENQAFFLDIKLILLTFIAIVNKSVALRMLSKQLTRISNDSKLLEVCKRESELTPSIPPGLDKVVTSR